MTSQTILIVDDEPYNVDYLEQELEGGDFKLLSAGNGQHALELIQAEKPDLILLDIMMPVMDGFEVLSKLKADPATRDIPVIVVSANNNLSSVVKGIELGAEDYLPKPFEPVLLHARVSSCLEKKLFRDMQKTYLKSLERELNIGREIQRGFLPAELPSVKGWDIAAYFKAAREVAGDFYDAFLLPDGNLACVIGDVCGKGVGAALFMTLFRSLFRATCTSELSCKGRDMDTLDPEQRLLHSVTFTNHYISETHASANMFATVFIGIINLQDGTLTYINCGNEPAILSKAGRPLISLPPTGPVVGVIDSAQYSIGKIEIEPGNVLIAFTDGIPDAMDYDDNSFGRERLLAEISASRDSVDELLVQISKHIEKFVGSASQFDDISILAVSRKIVS